MESALECGVCFSDYNSNEQRPKSLPCGHSICSSCVEDSLKANDGIMSCPFCRTPCGTGVMTLDDFPTTYALLGLLEAAAQKGLSENLSPEEEEQKVFQKKKKAEFHKTKAQITNCNEHLQGLLHEIKTQESAINSIKLRKEKLLEDYQAELDKLNEAEEQATSTKDQLDNTVTEGKDIVKGLEALQDRVQSADSIVGLNMISQDVQTYNAASQEWVTTKVKSILEDAQNNMSSDITAHGVTQGVECRGKFAVGESYYSCIQCRTKFGVALCGSCFVNSVHSSHRVEMRKSAGGGGYCDCGRSEVWLNSPTCEKHIRNNQSDPLAFNMRLQLLSRCKETFYQGDKCYTCLDCRTGEGKIMCGRCFINSQHIQHNHRVHTAYGDGAFCDCGRGDAWASGETCHVHQ